MQLQRKGGGVAGTSALKHLYWVVGIPGQGQETHGLELVPGCMPDQEQVSQDLGVVCLEL